MAKEFAVAAVLILIVASYWRPLRRLRVALEIDYLFSTGHAFLLLGYLLGLLFGSRLLPVSSDISPIVAFVAGWVGFATGIRFDLRVLRPVPTRAFAVALAPALGAFLAVGLVSMGLLLLAEVALAQACAAALVLGAAAASSGPSLIAVLRSRRAGRSIQARPVLRMIEFSAGMDDFIVVILALLAFGLFQPGVGSFGSAGLILITLGGGALLGLVTWLFLGGRANEDERLLLGLAMLAFAAGFAGWLQMPPAAVGAVAAMVLVNLPGERMARLLDTVRRVERPAVVILMAIIGFHVSAGLSWLFWPLLGAMTLVRFAAKTWGGLSACRFCGFLPGLKTSRRWGGGLAPQGVLGLVVTLSFYHVWQDEISRTILAAVAIGSILNELIAPWALLWLLRGLPQQASCVCSAKEDVV